VNAHAGFGLTKEQQELETLPKRSVLERLVSPGATPIRHLPIGTRFLSIGEIPFR